MAVEYQKVEIAFNQGIDTKSDPKQLQPGKLIKLQNGQLSGINRISKRRGYSVVATGMIAPKLFSAGRRIFASDVDGKMYAIGDAFDNGKQEVGRFSGWNARQWDIPGSQGQTQCIAVEYDQFRLTMVDGRLSAYSLESGDLIKSTTIASFAQPIGILKVNPSSSVYTFFYTTTSTTGFARTQFSAFSENFTTISSLSGVRDSTTDPALIAVTSANQITAVAYARSATSGIIDLRRDGIGTPIRSQTYPVLSDEVTAIDVAYESVTNSWGIVFSTYLLSGSTHINRLYYTSIANDSTLTVLVPIKEVTSTSAQRNRPNLSANADNLYEKERVAISALVPPLVDDQVLYQQTSAFEYRIDPTSGLVTGPFATQYGNANTSNLGAYAGVLLARPFTYQGDIYYPIGSVSGAFDQTGVAENIQQQSVVFLAKAGGQIMASALVEGQIDVASVDYISQGIFDDEACSFVVPYFSDLGPDGTGRNRKYALITFYLDAAQDATEVRGVLCAASGPLQLVSDQTALSVVPPYFPSGFVPDTPLATTGGSLTNGVYGFAAIFTYLSDTGLLHRSAPTFATVEFNGGTATQAFSSDGLGVLVPSTNFAQSVKIELYRTEANGSTYYFCGESLLPATSVFFPVDFANSVCCQADEAIRDNAVLYAQAQLANNLIPAPSSVETHQNRVFAASGDTLYYSKPLASGIAPEFSPLFSTRTGSSGQIEKLASMDASLIGWTKSGIFRLSGNGPDASGAGGGFSLLPLNSPVGLNDRESAVTTPEGIFFRSKRGLEILSRGLQVSPGGAIADNEFTADTAGAVVRASESQARWYLKNGKGIVYDYLTGQWSTFVLGGATSVTGVAVNNEDEVYVAVDGEIWTHPAGFLDAGEPYALDVRTGWLSFDGNQGYMRVRRMAILAEELGDHTLTVRVYYDYDESVVQTIVFNSAIGIPFGDDRYQFRARLARQKCSAIRFDFVSSAVNNPELVLSGLTLEVGVKGGISRLRDLQTL